MKQIYFAFAVIGLLFLFDSSVNAQIDIKFAKGASSKIISVTVPANDERSYAVLVKKGQVINVTVSGDIAQSRTIKFPVISVNLTNGEDEVDHWQDGEGYLSILTGTDGNFIFSVTNSSNRTRTFRMKVSVTNDPDDYLGGI